MAETTPDTAGTGAPMPSTTDRELDEIQRCIDDYTRVCAEFPLFVTNSNEVNKENFAKRSSVHARYLQATNPDRISRVVGELRDYRSGARA